MKAKLFCKTGHLAGKEFIVKKEAIIGKHPANDCVLDADIISGQHARIYYDDAAGTFFIEDLHSRNGTRLDGTPVKYKEKLGNLHVITFAQKFDFIFQRLKGRGEKTAAKSPREIKTSVEKTRFDQDNFVASPIPEAPAPVSGSEAGKTMFDQEVILPPSTLRQTHDPGRTRRDQDFAAPPAIPEAEPPPAKAPPAIFLEITSINRIFELKPGDNVVGRTDESDICLDEPSISRKHAVIRLKDGRVFVKDAGSKNKTFVNDVTAETEIEVASGATIRFGAVEGKLLTQKL